MRWGIAAVLLAAAVTSACGGGGGSNVADDAAPPSAAAPTSSSVAPVAPSASASPTAAPGALSAYEQDPAVQALRQNMLGQALAVNSNGKDMDDVRKSSTDTWFDFMTTWIDGERKRLEYPGPNAFIPVSVQTVSPTERRIRTCAIDKGWATNKATGQKDALVVVPGQVTVVKQKGSWKVNWIQQADFSCAGVTVPTEKFR